MGAWDTGIFDNDDALDWLYLLEEIGISAIQIPFDEVMRSRDWINVEFCAYTLAAADTLAALHGRPSRRVPPEITIWVEGQNQIPDNLLIEQASRAVMLVRDSMASELRELWSGGIKGEDDGDFKEWLQTIDDLLARLV